jgi:probable F420-dependent oxidoreductase
MKLGVIYPQVELRGDPTALRRFAVAAEAVGYDHLVIYDHLVGATSENRNPPITAPYDERSPFHDPLVAFGFLSGLTERIEFVVAVMIAPARQTVLMARQAADVDLMSNERLRLGVGAGYNPIEFHAAGVDFATRGKKLDQQIPYLRRLWSEELISYEGDFDQIDRANIVPRPRRQIPIWCGGFAEVMLRRAVKMADGFIFGYGLGDDAMQAWIRLQELLAKAGRSVEGFGAEFLMHPPNGPYAEALKQHTVAIYSDEETIDGMLRLKDAGATHVSLYTMDRGFTEVEQHIEYFAAIKQRYEEAEG